MVKKHSPRLLLAGFLAATGGTQPFTNLHTLINRYTVDGDLKYIDCSSCDSTREKYIDIDIEEHSTKLHVANIIQKHITTSEWCRRGEEGGRREEGQGEKRRKGEKEKREVEGRVLFDMYNEQYSL